MSIAPGAWNVIEVRTELSPMTGDGDVLRLLIAVKAELASCVGAMTANHMPTPIKRRGVADAIAAAAVAGLKVMIPSWQAAAAVNLN